MPDFGDLGRVATDLWTDAALDQQVGKSAPESHPDFDGVNCIECNEPIPNERLLLHRIRCVDCQSELEVRRARGLG